MIYPAKDTILGADLNGNIVLCHDDAKHIYVCGTTGSGKTVVLSNFIESAVNKQYGMLLIDGKGDIGENSMLDILKRFSKKFGRVLHVVDLNNPINSTKYNPFKDAAETIIKDMLINMSDWSEEHYKTNTERFVQRLIKLMITAETTLSFQSIISNLSSDKFEKLSVSLVKQGKISKDEHLQNLEISKASGKIAENASARFALIAESQAGAIFSESGIDIFDALIKGHIILFILNPLLYPELSPAFGRLILIDAKKAVSKLFGINKGRIFFLFDEANVYASPVLIDLINKSRSGNVTAILSTQSLADLEAAAGDPFKQQIIENCNNYIVLRQNSAKSAEEWAKVLGTKQTMQMTYQIGQNGSTGVGSARKTREFLYHPDDIKALMLGNAVYMSKDTGFHTLFKVRKPF